MEGNIEVFEKLENYSSGIIITTIDHLISEAQKVLNKISEASPTVSDELKPTLETIKKEVNGFISESKILLKSKKVYKQTDLTLEEEELVKENIKKRLVNKLSDFKHKLLNLEHKLNENLNFTEAYGEKQKFKKLWNKLFTVRRALLALLVVVTSAISFIRLTDKHHVVPKQTIIKKNKTKRKYK